MNLLRPRLHGSMTLVVVTIAALVGLAVGAAIHPVQTTAATTYTRAVSCQGRDFVPLTSEQRYGYANALRSGLGYFQCEADVPHKAVVTRVRFTVQDQVPNGEVRGCLLVRISLVASTAGAADVLASLPATQGTGLDAPYAVRLSTMSISSPTVDRLNYAYYLQCNLTLDSEGYGLGIWGADVTYKITAANG